jgi:tetratricopeptide (TPR) repeat protein
VGGNLITGFSHAFLGEFQKIEEMAKQTLKFCRDVGCEVWGTLAEIMLGITYVAKGQMSRGFKMIEQVRDAYKKNKRRGTLVIPEYVLGHIYLQIVEGENLPSLSVLARNIGFMVKNVPSAGKKAEDQFNRAIKIAKEVGNNVYLARAYLDLGLLHKAKKRTDQAKECISKAIELFEHCEAEAYLQQAKETLASFD